ncbi:unnamed protein product, partial [Sphacelaria rigidula]
SHHDAELHLVHEASDDSTLMVGIFFNSSPHNTSAELEKWWSVFDIGDGNTTDLVFPVRPYNLLPTDDTTYVHYTGSLTTPPCTEDVKWIVMNEPQLIGDELLMAYRSHCALLDDPIVSVLSA